MCWTDYMIRNERRRNNVPFMYSGADCSVLVHISLLQKCSAVSVEEPDAERGDILVAITNGLICTNGDKTSLDTSSIPMIPPSRALYGITASSSSLWVCTRVCVRQRGQWQTFLLPCSAQEWQQILGEDDVHTLSLAKLHVRVSALYSK